MNGRETGPAGGDHKLGSRAATTHPIGLPLIHRESIDTRCTGSLPRGRDSSAPRVPPALLGKLLDLEVPDLAAADAAIVVSLNAIGVQVDHLSLVRINRSRGTLVSYPRLHRT